MTCIVAGVLGCSIPLPAMACGGGGCGMGGRGGYYGGARSKASTKVLAGAPRAARTPLQPATTR
ncbi:MAG: hypothetical protein ACREBS_08420 [Nitrososphaerales archaeon]